MNPHRGSSAVTAEIMEEDAIYIRSSCRSHIELSEMFGVDHSAIRQVRRGATWAHVPTYENLLSEIAELRGDLTVSRDDLDQLQAHFRQRDREATQAERQRDEAVGLLKRWSLTRGEMSGAGTVETATSAFLANRGANQ